MPLLKYRNVPYAGPLLEQVSEQHLEQIITGFWMRVGVGGAEACWLWLGKADDYGNVHVCGQRWRVHRFSWFLHHGEILAGLKICHSCDVKGCVNPAHLFPAPQWMNLADCKIKRRGVELTNRSGETGLLDLTYETRRAYA